MTKQDDLIAYVFEDQAHRLSGELRQWMESASRFTLFVETYRDKIRKKVRVNREPESMLDLRSELEVAYRLLNHRRLAVTYEPYASAKKRGPDFAVTYRANLIFNVEVARIRIEESSADGKDERAYKEERILRILLNKLGQMQPGMANLLVIQTRDQIVRAVDLNQLMQGVKARVESKDPAFFAFSRYANPAAFYKDFLHLSGMVLWAYAPAASASAASVSAASAAVTPAADPAAEQASAALAVQMWANKQARPGLDEKVMRLVALTLQTPLPPSAGKR